MIYVHICIYVYIYIYTYIYIYIYIYIYVKAGKSRATDGEEAANPNPGDCRPRSPLRPPPLDPGPPCHPCPAPRTSRFAYVFVN